MNENEKAAVKKINDMRETLLIRIIPLIRKNGFQSLRMDDIAKLMDISKATMYKYFSSKEVIISGAVAILIDYINENSDLLQEDVESFGGGFQDLFEQSLLLTAYISEVFVADLQKAYPDVAMKLEEANKVREQKMTLFYKKGSQIGVFNEVNEQLLFLQEQFLIRSLIDPKFLMNHKMTLEQALWDYYRLKKIQLFSPDYLHLSDDVIMKSKIEFLSKKLTRDLF